ncbi:MAG: DsbA family protein, partial [Nannocystaceae bacterium]
GVRLVFKQMPLVSIHPNAMRAAQAALAGFNQDAGKGWAFHDKLFENSRTLTHENIERYAVEVGLDADQLKKDLDRKTYEQSVKDDMAYARKIGVNSTPTFFINGRMLKSRSVEAILTAVEEEKALARRLIRAGASPDEVYARIMRAANPKREAPKRPVRNRPGAPDPDKQFAVPTGGRPVQGPADALVTIIMFADFQCPFCKRSLPTIERLRETYPDDIRVVYRNLPLPMHKDARGAARAGLAAHKQGKFWEMHEAMFAKQKNLEPADLEAIAYEIGLDVATFKTDMDSAELKKAVADDMEIAKKFGVRGTPAFFINGRFVSGARPFEQFDTVVKEELPKARKFVAKRRGVRRDLYNAMAKTWETEFTPPPSPPVADHRRRTIDTSGLPRQGSTSPDVTIVKCADFDCPFSKRATGTIRQIAATYGETVAIHFAHAPLPMHRDAKPAHRAAVAAHAQGKFWEMHDLLFANQKSRTEADFMEFAR